VAQPHGDPLDLDLPDSVLLEQTERLCRQDPTFMPREEWERRFVASLG